MSCQSQVLHECRMHEYLHVVYVALTTSDNILPYSCRFVTCTNHNMSQVQGYCYVVYPEVVCDNLVQYGKYHYSKNLCTFLYGNRVYWAYDKITNLLLFP